MSQTRLFTPFPTIKYSILHIKSRSPAVTARLTQVAYLRRMQKVGILGGGQLGRMLLQAAANYPITTHVLEADAACPSAHLCHAFTQGDIRDYETVYRFGKNLQAITIEIENVNIEALEKLQEEGVKVYPKP